MEQQNTKNNKNKAYINKVSKNKLVVRFEYIVDTAFCIIKLC